MREQGVCESGRVCGTVAPLHGQSPHLGQDDVTQGRVGADPLILHEPHKELPQVGRLAHVPRPGHRKLHHHHHHHHGHRRKRASSKLDFTERNISQ
ncbi:hypothetical protein E2C01_009691 [Portunus trituberculatus]|uniref:Uncharacterized protein n=1 Tax=Portunus trituberculatus TaxID=210409 RepID=A0A5B7D6G2_PORTR|nr:hypothetical protein [Portunus trituberculatus]